MKSKFGFTLAELLITMGIIGIVAAITIPIILSKLPDREEQLQKKVTFMVEDMAAQMANDDIMYPKNREYAKQGFKNTDPIKLEGLDSATHTYEGNKKFCELFAHKFTRINSNVDCSLPTDGGTHVTRTFNIGGEDVTLVRSVRSGDEIDWYLPVTDFQSGQAMVIADINTQDKGENCFPPKSDTCKKPDTFLYYIRSNGTVSMDEPAPVATSPYTLTVKKICIDPPAGGVAACGTVTLKDTNGNSIAGTSGTDTTTFSGLENNKQYILYTTTATDYYSNWVRKVPLTNPDGSIKKDGDGKIIYGTPQINQRAFKLTGYDLNTTVKVRYNKVSRVCITVDVNDCNADSPASCVDVSLAKYNNGSYIGQNGTPSVTAQSATWTANNTNRTLSTCDWLPGDYQVTVTGKGDYKLLPLQYVYEEDSDGNKLITYDSDGKPVTTSATIIQAVKLGSENVKFAVTVASEN